MPMVSKKGKVRKNELPSTLRKSKPKAQRTFAKAHDAAAEEYGEGERAHRVAYSALKHKFEKVGDHWEKKDQEGAVRRAGQERWTQRERRDGGGRERQRHQDAPARSRQQARHLRPFEDEQVRTRHGDQEGESAGFGEEPVDVL